MSYRIPKHEAKNFDVCVSGRKSPMHIPLMSSLPVPWIRRVNDLVRRGESAGMDWFDFAVDLFCEYLGTDIVNEMTVEQINDLFAAWSDANEETEGANVGE